ncbi:MAG: flagellar hook-length control protein FliK [Alphaproteobacteria bacterium]|nr:flagellar hook-length control protein FliK [Alphaproteobacteria bacterium]MBU1560124.1 flagellar hook-length control protein FliK [Alphaproteobacteria bacterium]MBU2302592.1 flagellar hook-length control protein FliK [Alphaproteobacteria bacterium]
MTTIPSQLPQIVTAARSGALQALALQAGQVLDGKVVGPAPNGGTQVEIRGQMLNLLLPLAAKAGETLKFEVQGSAQQLRLALQMPTGTPISPATPAPAQPTQPATPVTPQASSPPSQGNPLSALVSQPQAPSVPSTPQPAVPANAATQPASIQPTPNPAPPPTASANPPTLPQPAAAQATPAGPAAMPAAATTQPAVPATPYPQSATPAPQPVPVAAASLGPAAHAPAAASAVPTGIRPVAPVSPATPAAGPTANQVPTTTAPQPAATQPATPQAAIAQMVQASVPRQGAVTSLTAALTGIAGKVVLPEPVARAAQQVLANRVAIDAPKFDGTKLQTAIRGAGIFQEAGLARGQLPLPQADMKSALLALRQTLVTWLGSQAPVAAVAHIPPPLKGGVLRARGAEAPPVDPLAAPEEVGKQLLERTESALARVRLHQHASLPDTLARTADWSMDLPVLIGSHQTLLQLQIHRDQHNEADASAERGWQMRFAISLPGMGEVGAQVSLRAGATGVMLWATEPGTSAALEAEVTALRETLAAAGLNPGAIIVRHGEPPTPPPAPSGHFVDSRT